MCGSLIVVWASLVGVSVLSSRLSVSWDHIGVALGRWRRGWWASWVHSRISHTHVVLLALRPALLALVGLGGRRAVSYAHCPGWHFIKLSLQLSCPDRGGFSIRHERVVRAGFVLCLDFFVMWGSFIFLFFSLSLSCLFLVMYELGSN